MAGLVIIIVGVSIVFFILWGVWIQMKYERDTNLIQKRRIYLDGGISIQDSLRLKFKTDDVYIYTENTWIVTVKTDLCHTHYHVNNNGKILAETNIKGSIYAMYKCNKLFIVSDDDITAKVYKWSENQLYGAVDDSFNVTIPIIYNKLDALEDNFVVATKNGVSGVYNPINELVVPIGYEKIVQDVKCKLIIGFSAGVYDIYEYDGKKIKSLDYDRIYLNSKDNLVKSNALINPEDLSVSYSLVKAKTFKRSANNKDDKAVDAQLLNGKWGLLDNEYNELIPPTYNLLYNGPSAALAMTGELNIRAADLWPGMSAYYLSNGGKWGVVGLHNEELIPILYDWIDFTPNENLFLVNHYGQMFYLKTANRPGFWGISGGKWGLVDRNNQIKVSIDYDVIKIEDHQILFQKSDKKEIDLGLSYVTFPI